jgi:hypothetical protein
LLDLRNAGHGVLDARSMPSHACAWRHPAARG